MKYFRFALFALSVAAACYAKPVIKTGGIVNAASWAISGLPNANIAQGSIFIIAGTDEGPTTLTQGPASYPLVKTIAGVSVTVSMNGSDTQAILFWVRNDYIAALLPSTVPTGTGTVTVTYNGETSDPAPITVVSNSIGIFSIGQNGQGPGVITDANKPQTSVAKFLVTQTNSAKPGDILDIWVTGVGAVPWDETKAPPGASNFQSKLQATVYVGTKAVTPSYAGPSGCCEGEGQIQIQLPADSPTGCYVPIAIVTGNQTSNVVTAAIDASGQTCSDQFGFSSAQIALLQSKGTLRFGSLSLSRSSLSLLGQNVTTDTASGSFESFTATSFAGTAGQQPSLNTCVVNQFASGGGNPGNVQFSGLDAGNPIALTGPNGNASLIESAQSKGIYSAGTGLPAGYLDATTGNFVFTGPGGPDVGAFTATVPATAPLNWTNQSSITSVTRSQGVTINWTNGDPAGYVWIFGSASASTSGSGETFICVAPNSAHTFTVPSWVTLSLPATGTGGGGTLAVYGFGKPQPFTATGLDVGTASESFLAFSSVTYQ